MHVLRAYSIHTQPELWCYYARASLSSLFHSWELLQAKTLHSTSIEMLNLFIDSFLQKKNLKWQKYVKHLYEHRLLLTSMDLMGLRPVIFIEGLASFGRICIIHLVVDFI